MVTTAPGAGPSAPVWPLSSDEVAILGRHRGRRMPARLWQHRGLWASALAATLAAIGGLWYGR